MESLGALIRRRREQRGIKPRQLGDAIGRTQQYVSQLETDRISTPPPDVVAGIATFLSIPEDALLRSMGYLSTVPPGEEDAPFPKKDPRSAVVELLGEIQDDDVAAIWTVVDRLARRSRG